MSGAPGHENSSPPAITAPQLTLGHVGGLATPDSCARLRWVKALPLTLHGSCGLTASVLFTKALDYSSD